MYLNKKELQALQGLTLCLKVNAKQYGACEKGTDEWHRTWNTADYAHAGILAITGDTDSRDRLLECAEYSTEAQDILGRLRYYGVNI